MKLRNYKYLPASLAAFACLLTLSVVLLGAGSRPEPLDLPTANTQEEHSLRNKKGELLLFNFRTVEPGVLYRGSGFPENVRYLKDGKPARKPAAYADGQMFDFLRARNIHLIVALQKKESFYRERGNFQWWSDKTGYKIDVVNLEIESGAKAYDRGSDGGLQAAAKFIELMRQRDPKVDGAVYIHCDAGKDRTGVLVAAYELWRNRGTADKDKLWQQVRARYLLSDTLIGSEPDGENWAGKREACGDGTSGFVCGKWLDDIRPDLERVAGL